ncbi:unnamed protein product [Bursaphelenchus okinawaensis]|uniref:Vacuolar protein sorting-associated protein 72 homolog n=1 Tax=Bursaphelenchus okinawaensis TaxID=465554 RepID=A0A811L5G0_9BILA|nr:unnamed protein product [Bursaphelenchus okinawaensis]CAG9117053.1 unnamed protein product [Bursaphelenchus okinawaensis]
MDKPSTSTESKEKTVRFEEGKEEDEETDEEQASDEESGEEEEESDDESSSDESVELPPPLAPNRSRRLNAGNRYTKVLAEEEHKAEGDEVYETLYGGFKEVENDDNFEVDSDEGSDEENKDLDDEEKRGETDVDDEKEGEHEEDVAEPKKKKKKPTVQKKPSWLMSQMAEDSVPLNALSTSAQAQRLKECKEVAAANRKSLEEMLKKQREEKEKQRLKPRARYLQGPKESYYSDKEKTYLLRHNLKQWKKPAVSERTCVVSGKEARYRDPVTGCYYFGIDEFKMIRQNEEKYLHLQRSSQNSSSKSSADQVVPSTAYPSSWSKRVLVGQDDEDDVTVEKAVSSTLIYLYSKSHGQEAQPPSEEELRIFRETIDEEKRPVREKQLVPAAIRRSIFIVKPAPRTDAITALSPRGTKRQSVAPICSVSEAKIQKLEK